MLDNPEKDCSETLPAMPEENTTGLNSFYSFVFVCFDDFCCFFLVWLCPQTQLHNNAPPVIFSPTRAAVLPCRQEEDGNIYSTASINSYACRSTVYFLEVLIYKKCKIIIKEWHIFDICLNCHVVVLCCILALLPLPQGLWLLMEVLYLFQFMIMWRRDGK